MKDVYQIYNALQTSRYEENLKKLDNFEQTIEEKDFLLVIWFKVFTGGSLTVVRTGERDSSTAAGGETRGESSRFLHLSPGKEQLISRCLSSSTALLLQL